MQACFTIGNNGFLLPYFYFLNTTINQLLTMIWKQLDKDEKGLMGKREPVALLNLSGLEVIKLEFILRLLRLKIKRSDWLLADMCPHAANHCALF